MVGKGVISKNFVLIFINNFIVCLALQMVNAILPTYMKSLGATASLIGFVSGMYSMGMMLIKPFAAPAVDAFNKKRLLTAGMIVVLIAVTGFSVSESIPVLIFFRLIYGLALGVTAVSSMTMISNSLPPEHFTSGVALYSISNAIPSAIGATVSLAINGKFGYRITVLTASAVTIVAIILTCFIDYEHVGNVRFHISLQSIFAKSAFAPALAILFIAAGYASIGSFLILYATSLGIENIGLYFTVNALTLLISRPVIGKAAEKYGAVKVIALSIVLFMVSMLLISYANNIYIFMLSGFIGAFGYGGCQPLIHALCMKSVPPTQRGAASATSYACMEFGGMIGPVILGVIVEKAGYAIMFRSSVFFVAAALLVLFLFRKQISRIGDN